MTVSSRRACRLRCLMCASCGYGRQGRKKESPALCTCPNRRSKVRPKRTSFVRCSVPPPPFSETADSKGVTGLFFVYADSKELSDKTLMPKQKRQQGCWRTWDQARYYPSNTLRCDTLFVKTKGLIKSAMWAEKRGRKRQSPRALNRSCGEKSKHHPHKTRVGHPARC